MRKIKQGIVLFLWLLSAGVCASSDDPRFQQEPSGASDARSAVEQVVIRAYEEVLQSGVHSGEELTNAPISGKADKRGRHLLSFAAFNQFPQLAQWGLDYGADINRGDKDHANMLRMSMGNYNIEMARFALKHDADPNILMGSGDDTMLSGLKTWRWPVSGFVLAKEFNALPRSEAERRDILSYLGRLPSTDSVRDVIGYIESAPLLGSRLPFAGTSRLISTSMIDVMDRHILAAMDSGELTERDMDNFQVKGKGFEAFLTFNGFTRSVTKRLAAMDHAKAVSVVKTLDVEGNDLLAAAIKSLNDEAVEAILVVTSETVNAEVSDRPYHYSKGDRPLHMAIRWDVPARIFALLVSHGADPDLTNTQGTSARRLLAYYQSDWRNAPGKYEKVKSLFRGQ